MKPEDILKFVDAIHQEKGIERELIFQSIEIALSKAAGKKLVDIEADPEVIINRETGDVAFYEVEIEEQVIEEYDLEAQEMVTVKQQIRHIRPDGVIPIDPAALGRVAAQTAKQVIIQRLREAERDAIYDEYIEKKGDIVVGTVVRFEGPSMVVNLDNRVEGFFPRREQVRDEQYEVGERVKALVLDVKKTGQKVKIILSRTHPDFVRRLFQLEVPEIADHIIEINKLVREPGYRSKVAVSSIDSKVDAVGACVGMRGQRIKGIIEELNGEKIDIIRFNPSAEVLIQNALKPATIASITLDYDATKARVVVPDDQLSLAIGKGGQNVRLASKLTGWDIDIMSQIDERKLQVKAIAKFETIPGVEPPMAEAIFAAGYARFDELLDAGPEILSQNIEGITDELAQSICEWLENVDEEEYYREVEVEMPVEVAPISAQAKIDRLFQNLDAAASDAGTADGSESADQARTAAELFASRPAPAETAETAVDEVPGENDEAVSPSTSAPSETTDPHEDATTGEDGGTEK